jgi:hypothetical protein
MLKFHKYHLNLDPNVPVIKDESKSIFYDFGRDVKGAADGLTVHESTGWLVSSCPDGLCIVHQDGEILSHIKITDQGEATSNIAWGKDSHGTQYAYITGDEKVWRIRLKRSTQNQEL